ncbi:hypothetical protein PHYPO_G00119130 [Pangasianodon hypophthalmus]|uniref:PH domain-containing protein n=1 Tax=Pangasianodon hypophthalmus TaxID=310915 RepID=A0A5N5KYN1_PANHP|nr:hypothetical protein PHYPO_G00119130 [Pangasianodon hypophthalmus]
MSTAGVQRGFLKKYGGFMFKQWKEKYVVLTVEGRLMVCKDADSPPEQVVVLQSNCQSIVEGREILDLPRLPPGGRRDCCFALILPQDKFLLLLSDNPDDCSDSKASPPVSQTEGLCLTPLLRKSPSPPASVTNPSIPQVPNPERAPSEAEAAYVNAKTTAPNPCPITPTTACAMVTAEMCACCEGGLFTDGRGCCLISIGLPKLLLRLLKCCCSSTRDHPLDGFLRAWRRNVLPPHLCRGCRLASFQQLRL